MGDDRIKLVSLDTNRSESFTSLEHLFKAKRYRLPLLAEIVKFFHPKGGFSLTTNSEAPAGAGIGGSSAMAVAICAALDRFTGAGRSKVDWVHISRDAEAIVIHIPTGMQDHYPPAFGGAAAIELIPGGERRIEINVNLDELERRLVVCYTGKPRQSAINNWGVFKAHIDNKKTVVSNLERISQIAQKLRDALAAGDWAETGPADARGMAVPPQEPADHFDEDYRPDHQLHTAQRGAGGEGVRRRRRRLRGAAD